MDVSLLLKKICSLHKIDKFCVKLFQVESYKIKRFHLVVFVMEIIYILCILFFISLHCNSFVRERKCWLIWFSRHKLRAVKLMVWNMHRLSLNTIEFHVTKKALINLKCQKIVFRILIKTCFVSRLFIRFSQVRY